MRLLETVIVPAGKVDIWSGINPNYQYFAQVAYNNSVGLQDHFLFLEYSQAYGGVANPPPIKPIPIPVRFGQPRLGRSWQVERAVVTFQTLFVYWNTLANQWSANFQLYLNDVPIGDTKSIVTSIPVTAAGTVVDLTSQNGPLTVEPFQSLELNSGDNLSIVFTDGIAVPQATAVQHMQIGFRFTIQLIGENQGSVPSRS